MVTKLVVEEDGNFNSSQQSFVTIEGKKVIVDGDLRPNPSPPPTNFTMVSTQSFVKIEGKNVAMVGDTSSTTTQSFVYIEV